MKEFVPINLNDHIKVKLTEKGIAELRRQHEEHRKTFPSLGEFKEPEVDEDGYSTFQIWPLMNELGHMFENGFDPPMKPGVLIEVDRRR